VEMGEKEKKENPPARHFARRGYHGMNRNSDKGPNFQDAAGKSGKKKQGEEWEKDVVRRELCFPSQQKQVMLLRLIENKKNKKKPDQNLNNSETQH